LHNSNSERSELLRCLSWGWIKEKKRKEAAAVTGEAGREGGAAARVDALPAEGADRERERERERERKREKKTRAAV